MQGIALLNNGKWATPQNTNLFTFLGKLKYFGIHLDKIFTMVLVEQIFYMYLSSDTLGRSNIIMKVGKQLSSVINSSGMFYSSFYLFFFDNLLYFYFLE